jgi:hypothetical protein
MIVFGSSRVYVVVPWVATNLFRYKLTRDSFHGFPWLLLSLFLYSHILHYISDRDNVEWTRTLALFVIPLYLHDVVLLRYV